MFRLVVNSGTFVLVELTLELGGNCSGGFIANFDSSNNVLRPECVVHFSGGMDSRLLRRKMKTAVEMTRKEPPHSPPMSGADTVGRDE